MTAKEKEQIQTWMIKSVFSIAEKHELKYKDLVIMALGIAECIVRFCIREGIEGCKKNSCKVKKMTIRTFTEYANRDMRDDSWWLKDDENNNEKDE